MKATRKAARFGLAGAVLMLSTSSPLSAADAPAGKATYDKSCVGCHGANGKGNPAMIKVMGEKGLNITTKETKDKSDKELLKIITDGKGKMPPAKGISEKQAKEVLGYARSLAK